MTAAVSDAGPAPAADASTAKASEPVDAAAPAADSGAQQPVDAGRPVRPPPEHPAAFARPAFCDRQDERVDNVRTTFCAEKPPLIAGLLDLQYALGVQLGEVNSTVNSVAVVLAHSTSLAGEVVSEINPRTIITSPVLFLAFSRGVQTVELAAADQSSTTTKFNFYLVEFKQACNDAAQGCKPGDLFTPSIESNWLSFTLTDDEELKNSALDCRQCHQRNAERPFLLMRELDGPWTHFFGPEGEDPPESFPEITGTALMRDYVKAKGDEIYGGLHPSVIRSTVGFTLQNMVSRPQPLLFEGSQILNERWPYSDGGYPAEPVKSETWYKNYNAFKRGEELPLPYFEPRVSDKAKIEKLTAAYQRYAKGELPAAELPDFRDMFPDDPQVRAEIGLQTEPKATPAETLIQACGSCHNDVLDQTISRARFNVALSRMSRQELDVAIQRLELPRNMPGAMPPAGRRVVAPENMAALIEYLRKAERPAADDTMLDHAALKGMAGPENVVAGPGR